MYAVRDRMLRDIEERRSPRTSATVAHLLDKHLDQFSGAPNTLQLYRGYVKNHIEPLVGRLEVGERDAEILDSFYAELRRCRDPLHRRACGGRATRSPAERPTDPATWCTPRRSVTRRWSSSRGLGAPITWTSKTPYVKKFWVITNEAVPTA